MKQQSETHLGRLQEEVQKTLQLLQPLPQEDPAPNFYTRLQARLYRENQASHTEWPESFLRLLIRPAFLAFFILVNLVSTYLAMQPTSGVQADRLGHIQALVREYDMQNTSYDPLSANFEVR